MKIRSLVKFNTLLLLKRGPVHGYELMKELERELGKVSTSQVYPFLNELERKGYVKVEERGARDKKVYSLTNKGRELVKELLHRFEDLINIAVSDKLKTCEHCGCKIYEGGVELKGKWFCCENCAKAYFKLNK